MTSLYTKSNFAILDIEFLAHKISVAGTEVDSKKCNKFPDWPVPTNARPVRSFLGFVLDISAYRLAEHTAVLIPLTSKESDLRFSA